MARNGWHLYAHPMFQAQFDKVLAAVARAKRADPEGWKGHANARLLAALVSQMLDRIPRDPLASEFRQGGTLGRDHRHWFGAKFGGSRFRLFYRADAKARIIVFAWVNDRETLRKPESSFDPYAVFAHLLSSGNPADGWPGLLATAKSIEETSLTRLTPGAL